MAEPDATPAEPTPAEALAKILACVRALPVESRPLAALRGAALAEAICAERDQPPFDRVTMDGVALASSAWAAGRRRFRIAGVQAAGAAPLAAGIQRRLPRGHDRCGAAARLRRRRAVRARCRSPTATLNLRDEPRIEPFMNVHTRALDCRAGERLLESGTRIGGPELDGHRVGGPRACAGARGAADHRDHDGRRTRRARASRSSRGRSGARTPRIARRVDRARLHAGRGRSPAGRPARSCASVWRCISRRTTS